MDEPDFSKTWTKKRLDEAVNLYIKTHGNNQVASDLDEFRASFEKNLYPELHTQYDEFLKKANEVMEWKAQYEENEASDGKSIFAYRLEEASEKAKTCTRLEDAELIIADFCIRNDGEYKSFGRACAEVRRRFWKVITPIILAKENYVSFENDDIFIYDEKKGVWKNGEWEFNKIMENYNLRKRPIEIFDCAKKTEVITRLGHLKKTNRNEFDTNRRKKIGFRNGVMNIETWQFEPHAPENCLLSVMPTKYDPEQDAPVFSKFITEVLGDDDNIRAVEEMMGYCLVDDFWIHKSFMFFGEGANGKGTLIWTIAALLGRENVANIPLQELETNRYAKAELYGKKANFYADLAHNALKTTGIFKTLTGGDSIMGEQKFKNPFMFKPTCKLIFSANQIPSVRDMSDAYFRRWRIICFEKVFSELDADKTLIDKLTTPAELSGIANFALAGLQRLVQQGQFSGTEDPGAVREVYMRLSDSVSAFVADVIEETYEDTPIPKQTLLGEYYAFCKQNRLPPANEKVFFTKLREQVRITEQRSKIDGKQTYCYVGIQLKNNKAQKNENEQKTLN